MSNGNMDTTVPIQDNDKHSIVSIQDSENSNHTLIDAGETVERDELTSDRKFHSCLLYINHFALGKMKDSADLHRAKKEYVERLMDKPTDSRTIVFDKNVQHRTPKNNGIESIRNLSSQKPNESRVPQKRTSIGSQEKNYDANHNNYVQKTTLNKTTVIPEAIYFSKIPKNRIAHKPSPAIQNPYPTTSSVSSNGTSIFGGNGTSSTSRKNTSATDIKNSFKNQHDGTKKRSSESHHSNDVTTPMRIIDESQKRKRSDSDVAENMKKLVGMTQRRGTTLNDPPKRIKLIPPAIHDSKNRTVIYKPSSSHPNSSFRPGSSTKGKFEYQRMASSNHTVTSGNHAGSSSEKKSTSKERRSSDRDSSKPIKKSHSSDCRDSSKSTKKRHLSDSSDSRKSTKKSRSSEDKSKTIFPANVMKIAQSMNNDAANFLNSTLQQVSKLQEVNMFDTEDNTCNAMKPFKIPKVSGVAKLSKEQRENSTSASNMTKDLKKPEVRSTESTSTNSPSEIEKPKQRAPTASTDKPDVPEFNDFNVTKLNPRVVLTKIDRHIMKQYLDVRKEKIRDCTYSSTMLKNNVIKIKKKTKEIQATSAETGEVTQRGVVIPTQANFSQQTDSFTCNFGTQKSDDETEALIKELHSQIKALTESARVQEEVIKDKSREIEFNKNKIDEQLKVIEEREKIIAERELHIKERNSKILEGTKKIDLYEAEIKEKQNRIDLQQLKMDQLTQNLTEYHEYCLVITKANESVCEVLKTNENNCKENHEPKKKPVNRKKSQVKKTPTTNTPTQNIPQNHTAVSPSNDNNMISANGNIDSSSMSSAALHYFNRRQSSMGSSGSGSYSQAQNTMSATQNDFALPTSSMAPQQNSTALVPHPSFTFCNGATQPHTHHQNSPLQALHRMNQKAPSNYDLNSVTMNDVTSHRQLTPELRDQRSNDNIPLPQPNMGTQPWTQTYNLSMVQGFTAPNLVQSAAPQSSQNPFVAARYTVVLQQPINQTEIKAPLNQAAPHSPVNQNIHQPLHNQPVHQLPRNQPVYQSPRNQPVPHSLSNQVAPQTSINQEMVYFCLACHKTAHLVCKTCRNFATCNPVCNDLMAAKHVRECPCPNMTFISNLESQN